MKLADDMGEHYTLQSGRTFYACCGVLSLLDGDLVNGFDSRVDLDDEPLTAQERQEIADHAIRLWQEWAAGV